MVNTDVTSKATPYTATPTLPPDTHYESHVLVVPEKLVRIQHEKNNAN